MTFFSLKSKVLETLPEAVQPLNYSLIMHFMHSLYISKEICEKNVNRTNLIAFLCFFITFPKLILVLA